MPEGVPFSNTDEGMDAIYTRIRELNPDAFANNTQVRSWLSDERLTPHHLSIEKSS
jgi:hypothetical protein